MFNRINEQKTMKKFWNLMLVALVMLGAAACTENNDTVDVNAESLSFYAEIANEDTRADLEYDQQSKLWKTVWEGNETINVKSGLKGFDFTNSKEEPNKFTCTAPGVSTLANKTVTVSISNKDQSTVGKKGLVVNTVIDSFDTSKTISLTAANSFLRYAYNGEGELTISLTYANGAKSFVYDNQAYDSVTFKGGNGENWVSFNPQEGEATLSYSINGVECKRKAINVIAGKIYNLGELVPAEYLYFVPNNNWKSDNAWFAAHFYNANDGYADIKLADDNNDGVYECVVPTAMTGVTFCRMNPAFTEFGWNEEGKEEQHVWNQTGGLTIDKDNNYFYLYTDSWSEGVWNVAGYVVGATPRNFGLAGLNGNWDTDIDMTLEGDYFTLKSVKIAATDTFKLRVNDSWNESYGASGDVEPFTIEANKGYTLSAGGKNLNIAAGTYDIYFNDTTKDIYVLTVGTTPEDLSIPQYKVYVYNYGTKWSSYYLYMWDENETFIFGAWPGATATAKETINGYEYMVWTMPKNATGKKVSVILNNNSGAQTADYSLGTIDSDKYILLNDGVADEIKDINNPEPVVPATTHKIYVYKHNNSWSTVNLYAWDSVTDAKYTGGWPGTKMTDTKVINGYTYYVFEMPAAATDRKIRMIFNNGSAQTGDSDIYTLDKDLYICLNGSAIQDIEDPENPVPTVVAMPRKIYATTTLSWSKMNIYAWGGGASFSWPGTQMSTETINGTKYYVYTFDASFDGVTLSGVIFNNGSAQTVDVTNVKLDQDRFFRVLTTKTDGKYKCEAIADPRK